MSKGYKDQQSGAAFRFHYLINKNFQVKYTVYLVTSAIFSSLLVGGPTYYFLHQNYEIFLNLAYTMSPEIIQHLLKEETWITGFFLFSLFVLIIFHVYIGVRLTFRMAGPLVALKRHMTLVTKGHLYQKPLHIRQDDEFHDIIKNYNYLYKTLRAQNSFDIKKLEAIKYAIKDSQGQKVIDEMILEKEAQLQEPFSKPSDLKANDLRPSETSSLSAESHASDHAS